MKLYSDLLRPRRGEQQQICSAVFVAGPRPVQVKLDLMTQRSLTTIVT